MVLNAILGTPLDAINLSNSKLSGYRVLLFDLSADDSLSDIVLDRYQQVPLDITNWVQSCDITVSHDTEANSANFTFVGVTLDWRVFLNSWVKVYEGDLRVPQDQWPIIFSGVFRGQPARSNARGELERYSMTAFDRSMYFRDRSSTSYRAWQPQDSDANLGTICRQIATDADWGLGLDPQEVLFGKFFDGIEEVRLNKRLQVVDNPLMDSLTTIMQVVQRQPGFNAEGKLVARRVDLDRPAVRVYADTALIAKQELPAMDGRLTTSVTVQGLDFRQSRIDYPVQKMITIGPVTIGMFSPTLKTRQTYSENNDARVVVESTARNLRVQGALLAQIFALDDRITVGIVGLSDFECECTVTFHGAFLAILIVTVSLAVYIGLRLAADAIGATNPLNSVIAFALDATATVLLFLVMQMMTAIGTAEWEVWGVPFEYVYRELEARAVLADTEQDKDEPKVITNHILGSLDACANLARDLLRRYVAESAQRSLTLSNDLALEPNDIIELDEEGERARYYVQEIRRSIGRDATSGTIEVTAFRVR